MTSPQKKTLPQSFVVKCPEFEGKVPWKEFCLFHEITGFATALLQKMPNSQHFATKLRGKVPRFKKCWVKLNIHE